MSSTKLLEWYKTMIEEEHRLNAIKHEIKIMAEAQKNEMDMREQALFDKEIQIRELKIQLKIDIKEVVN